MQHQLQAPVDVIEAALGLWLLQRQEGVLMAVEDHRVEPGSEADLAIERALDAANLRAGGSLGASTTVVEDWEPSAAEAGDASAGFDGD